MEIEQAIDGQNTSEKTDEGKLVMHLFAALTALHSYVRQNDAAYRNRIAGTEKLYETVTNAIDEVVSESGKGRWLGQLMPLGDIRYPVVVMRKTCMQYGEYLGRLPAGANELATYKSNCGLDPQDIYTL